LADSIRSEAEALTEQDLDLKVVESEVSIPREQFEEFVSWFVGDDDLDSALRRFGSHVPTGDPDENRTFVQELMAEHPLQFLVSHVHIGPNNSVLRSSDGLYDGAEQALVNHEARRASMFSLFAIEILSQIEAKYGPLANGTGGFATEIVEPSVAQRIGRALALYSEGDYDSCASVLAPRLERIVRRIAAGTGLTTTKSPDRHGRAGGVKGLGELLALLDGPMPEPSRRYLKVLLSEVTGLNLRNRIGHGLDDEVAQREAALLIHCACHLRLLRPAPGGSGGGDRPISPGQSPSELASEP
ncbi:MAG: DUF4209 domain-containing protein, partial [Acidimicrobiia bacterium]